MTDTPIEVLNKYSKQIDELAENAEIEAELDAEKEIRSKNTKIIGISTVALSLMGVVYFLVQSGNDPDSLDTAILEANQPVLEEQVLASNTMEEEIVNDEPLPPLPEKKVEVKSPPKQIPVAGKITKAVLKTENPKPVVKKIKRTPRPAPKITKVSAIPAPIAKPKKKPERSWSIQVGAFSIKDNADRFSKKLKDKGFRTQIRNKITTSQKYFVLSGLFPEEKSAVERMKQLSEKGYKSNLKKLETGDYTVILGQFRSKSLAEKLKKDLRQKGFMASAPKMPASQTTYTVQVAGYDSVKTAKKDKVRLASLGFKSSFIH